MMVLLAAYMQKTPHPDTTAPHSFTGKRPPEDTKHVIWAAAALEFNLHVLPTL